MMTIQFENVGSEGLLPGDSQSIHIRRNPVILPSGEDGVTEYASQGTGLGVIIIPMTVGRHRLLTRKYRHSVDSAVWEFPRAIVPKISVSEAEKHLLHSTGIQATCRLIGNLAPDSGALNTQYGVYEAFVDSSSLDGSLPLIPVELQADTEWFSEERFALHVRDAEINDALTLAAIAMQTIEAMTANV